MPALQVRILKTEVVKS